MFADEFDSSKTNAGVSSDMHTLGQRTLQHVLCLQWDCPHFGPAPYAPPVSARGVLASG
jgi:hypothetical protein